MARRAAILIIIAALAVGGRAVRRHGSAVAAVPRPSAAQVVDANTDFYESVAARDRSGALALGRLAQLYMRRARATGNYEDVLRSESAARRSLVNRGTHNAGARQ